MYLIDMGQHWRVRLLNALAHILGYPDPLSGHHIEIYTLGEHLIKKAGKMRAGI